MDGHPPMSPENRLVLSKYFYFFLIKDFNN